MRVKDLDFNLTYVYRRDKEMNEYYILCIHEVMNKENEQYEYGYIDGNTIIEKE